MNVFFVINVFYADSSILKTLQIKTLLILNTNLRVIRAFKTLQFFRFWSKFQTAVW